VASDLGAVVVTAGIKSTSSGSIGIARLTVAGVTVTAGFSVHDQSVPLPLVMPRVTLPSSNYTLGLTLEVTSGVAAQMEYSSIRITS
jgi:hypothetical protein